MFVSGETQLSEEDFFQALAKSERADSYCNSLAYYMLTGRRGATIYTDGEAYLVIARHPHIDDRLLVFPEVNGDGSLTFKVLSELVEPLNGIQLARYTDEDLEKLQNAAEAIPAHKQIDLIEIEESVMDWVYPNRILDTSVTAELKGKIFHPVRANFSRASERLHIEKLDSPNAVRAIRAAVLIWNASMIYADKENGHSLTEYYDTLVKVIEKAPYLFDGFITFDGREPAGFTIWDKPQNGTVNAIAGLSRRSIKGMSEFQTVTACRMLSERGVTHYNLGGSETASLDHHKRMYQPTRSIEMKSYDVRVRNLLMYDIKSIDMPRI